jgi:DNA polymerase
VSAELAELAGIRRGLRQMLAELQAEGVEALPRAPAPVSSPATTPRCAPASAASAAPAPAASAAPVKVDASGLEAVRLELGECTRCRLCETRKQIVFGEGNPQAAVVFVGEGPGADEDRSGRPFVGRAGQLLDKMIESVGWKREEVYICNVVKCRPPGNRNPELDEVATCRPFLEAQLRAISPRAIVTLGKPAATTLLDRNVAITRERGVWREWEGIPLMPTFHPAYVLRQYTRENRQAVWDDLRAVRERVDGS